jgi:hypothetical protein
MEPLVVTLPTIIKNKIKEDAEEKGLTMDEYVSSIIKEKYPD